MLTARRLRLVLTFLVTGAGQSGMPRPTFADVVKDPAPTNDRVTRAKLRRQLIAERTQVRKRGAVLEAEAKAIAFVKRDLKVKTRIYETARYDLCPNGCSFNGCIHEDFKQQWLIFLRQLYLEIQRLRDELDDRLRRFEPALDQFTPVAHTLNKKIHDYNKENMTFKKYNKKDDDYLNYYESKILGIKVSFKD